MFDPARQIEECFAVLGDSLECGRRPISETYLVDTESNSWIPISHN